MPRIHTRTNNVDIRVQGLVYNYINTYVESEKVTTHPNVFYLQRLSAGQISVYHDNECEGYLIRECKDCRG